MTKILEHASRVLAIMGIALVVWAGMGVQTAKAQVVPIEVKDGWLDPCVPHAVGGMCSMGNVCPFGYFCRRDNLPPALIPGKVSCCKDIFGNHG